MNARCAFYHSTETSEKIEKSTLTMNPISKSVVFADPQSILDMVIYLNERRLYAQNVKSLTTFFGGISEEEECVGGWGHNVCASPSAAL
jgi:hypothetical protein